jgi:hypothetical protein
VRNDHPPNRHLYAEDFVRPVDIHDSSPLEYVGRRPGHETSGQHDHARAPAYDANQIRVVSDPRGLVSTGRQLIHSAHAPPILHPVTSSAVNQPPSGYHERRPGITSTR